MLPGSNSCGTLNNKRGTCLSEWGSPSAPDWPDRMGPQASFYIVPKFSTRMLYLAFTSPNLIPYLRAQVSRLYGSSQDSKHMTVRFTQWIPFTPCHCAELEFVIS